MFSHSEHSYLHVLTSVSLSATSLVCLVLVCLLMVIILFASKSHRSHLKFSLGIVSTAVFLLYSAAVTSPGFSLKLLSFLGALSVTVLGLQVFLLCRL